MIPVIVSFLPPTHTHLYLPFLFKFWEAINSSLIDERLLYLAGQLAEEHLEGHEEGRNAEWKDVGIWSQSEWDLLTTKGLGSMSTPPYEVMCACLTFRRCSRWCQSGIVNYLASRR